MKPIEETIVTFRNVFEVPAGSLDPVRRSMSDRIRIARGLCIVFMTFVHVPPGIGGNVYARDAGVFDLVYFALSRMVGLSSVSLLSVVSGYFIVSSLAKAGTHRLFVSKVKTLVVPLVAWNLLMLALLALYGLMRGKWQDMPDFTAPGMADALVALTGWPLDVPLWFLRDLFVCCLFSPLLYVALKRVPVATILLLIAYTLFGEDLYLLQRPQLMLFFALGMWLRLSKTAEPVIDRMARWLLPGLVVMVVFYMILRIENVLFGDMADELRLTLDTALRITMAAGFWLLTDAIRRSRFAGGFLWFEPYAFFLFCSHAILFHFAAIPLRRVFGNYGSDLFAITFFALPCLAVIGAVIGLQVINGSRPLLVLFNAGHGVASLRKVAGHDARAARSRAG
ncbi:acyltransferase family protein [Ollibium composti]|uniref:Acyltransferase n=1 Tax=Ollibium composti TaxID=2675109 RepID=A0ABY2Q2K3_9HYPH|nr:acyltransferase family protein [Mesorhizobium composti]THF55218.1 acyltransferase [Mesorhizobium composti]